MDNYLSVFPRLRYIGGAVGHGLDLFISGNKAQFIRLSLGERSALAIERVVLYGEPTAEGYTGGLVDLIRTARVSQSSVWVEDGLSKEDALRQYGPQKAANGIVNGYDYSSTADELAPWWKADLGQICSLQTIHISNFCSGKLAYRADSLKIESSLDGVEWKLLYDRSSAEVLSYKFNRTFELIERVQNLVPAHPDQASTRKVVLELVAPLKSLVRNQGTGVLPISLAMSEHLLDLVDAFLPYSIEPGLHPYIFRNLGAIKAVNISYPDAAKYPPKTIVITEPNGTRHEFHDLSKVTLDETIMAATLEIDWRKNANAYRANSMRVSVSAERNGIYVQPITNSAIIYDNAEVVDICAGVAWAAFMMGNDSARCIGLISKTRVMPRRSHADLTAAYLWCRLNIHARNKAYKEEVRTIVNSATLFDNKSTRLQFGRHEFSVALSDRNHTGYVEAIESIISALSAKNVRAFLMYGTLLGAVRAGSFIDHDDDVDLGYLSGGTSQSEIMAERKELIEHFAGRGWLAWDLTNHQHLSFTIAVPIGDEIYPIELFPVWKKEVSSEKLSLYMQKMEIGEVPEGVIGEENAYVELCGRSLPAPSQPENFLLLRYGADWRIPNPFFEI